MKLQNTTSKLEKMTNKTSGKLERLLKGAGKKAAEFCKSGRTSIITGALIGASILGGYGAGEAKGATSGRLDIANNLVEGNYTNTIYKILHTDLSTEGYDASPKDIDFIPNYLISNVNNKIVSKIPSHELINESRPYDSNTPVELELSLISQNASPITIISENKLVCTIDPQSKGYTFPGKTITLQEYNPSDPNQKFQVYDVRKQCQWNNGEIPLAPLNGTYTSGQVLHNFTLFFDRNPCDFNNDGKIDFGDLSIFITDWMKTGNYLSLCDITGPSGEPDGNVNLLDFSKFSENWLVEY